MRTIPGTIVLPPDAPQQTYDRLVVEIRDVSMADAPSVVIAEQTMEDVTIEPNGAVKFSIDTPDVGAGRALSLRVHISREGARRSKKGICSPR